MNISDDFPMIMEVETDLNPQSMHYTQPMQGCPPLSIAFGMYPQVDGDATRKAGHPVYKDVEFVKIASPGDRNSMIFQPSNQSYRDRFPRAYAAFKARDKAVTEGTPIEMWAAVTRSEALNLRAFNICSVEALAAVHDGHIDRIPGNGRMLRAKASAWLADAKQGAETLRKTEENEELRGQIAALQTQMAALVAAQGTKSEPANAPAQYAAPTLPQSIPGFGAQPVVGGDDVECDVADAARRARRAKVE